MKNEELEQHKSVKGQLIVEVLLAFGLSSIMLPALLVGFTSSREGKWQQVMKLQATALLAEAEEAARSVREAGWDDFAVLSGTGPRHPAVSGSVWTLTAGAETVGDFTRTVVISDLIRDGTNDPSTKIATITIAWNAIIPRTLSSTLYLTRYLDNVAYNQSTAADFNSGTLGNVQVTNTAGGEVILSNNNKAKWCSPELSPVTIDLPDGPPVAVAAMSDLVSSAVPNDVFVAVSPQTTTSTKLAYVQTTANTDPPVSTLRGTFTLDVSKYSNPSYVPSGIGFGNDFKTNDVKYYKSASGKTYALLATDLPDREVVAILIKDENGNEVYQDPVGNPYKIYKYQTFFNTKIYGPSTDMNTGFINPTANAADSGGDGDGYGTNPTRAYSNNSLFAVDTNSGSGTSTNCDGADKDRHRFYNYGLVIPGGASIAGIEVRLDARADNAAGSPKICIELSWDGGITWTVAKSTNTLTTGEATYILGGAADTWGHVWSDGEFANANFRLRVTNVASDTLRDFSLDWAAVKVYYSGGSGASSNDLSPFGYGAVSLAVLGDRGYVAQSGYLYVFDLTNIDAKSSSSGLDMVGCRIELDGFDCSPGTGIDRKYASGETGTSWSATAWPVHPDTCYDGGNIELYADNDVYPVQVGANTYVHIAVGAGTNPEMNIVNTTSVPTGSSSPSILSTSCGRISGGNSGWKRIGSLDFNTTSGTEEAANSVYVNAEGTRAYISSNGGIDANGDGQPDSYQLYVINTNNPASPVFLSGSSTPPTSGYYYGTGANVQFFPRRSLTVLNGQRAILVGKDSVSDGNDAQEYEVLNIETEATPAYCGGVNFDAGFNDLTSVSEADGDNFVYMVANTMDHQLKIIQGGPDSGIYVPSGTYESVTFDAGASAAFNRFTATINQPANTTLRLQVAAAPAAGSSCSGASFDFVGPDGDTGAYFTPVAASVSASIPLGTYGGYQNPARCFRYRTLFDTTDYNQSPTLYDMSVNYSP